MANEVAYKPLVSTKAPEFDKKAAQIPPYDDEGVSYKGYSKRKIGENEYELKPQSTFRYTWKTGAFGPSTSISDSIGAPVKGKKLYIKSLQLNTSVTGTSSSSYFRISDPSGKVFFENSILRSETINIYFDVPLVVEYEYDPSVTPSGCQLAFSSGSITVNQATINVQGWQE